MTGDDFWRSVRRAAAEVRTWPPRVADLRGDALTCKKVTPRLD